MDNKKYGVELTADISDLKSKLEEAKKITEKTKDNIETSLRKVKVTRDGQKQEIEISTNKAKKELQETAKEFEKRMSNIKPKITFWNDGTDLADVKPGMNALGRISKAEPIKPEEQKFYGYDPDFMKVSEEIKENINKVTTSTTKAKEEMASLGEETEETEKKSKGLTISFTHFGDDISKTIKKSVSSIKKFTLSLIGIRGAYSIITKSANAYMSLDNKMSTRLKANWIALGAIFSPIIEKIVKLFQKAVAYINIFVKTLTGGKVDLLSKAMKAVEKSTGKTTKQVKKLNNELSALDEIENLNFDNDGADEDEFDVKSALEEIQNIELNPKIVEIVEKVATYIKDKIIPTVKDLYNWFKDLNIPWKLIGATILAIKLGPMGALILAVGALVGKILEAKKAWENFKESQNQVKNTQVKGLQLISQKIEENNDKIANGNLSDEEKSKLQTQNNTLLNEAQRYYEQINREQKNGVQYTQAEITEIENLKTKIEDLSGTKIDIEINWLSNTKNLNMFSKLIEQILGAGLGANGGILSSLRKGLFGFARGNVAYEPTVAQFGEYAGARSNPEITTPQNVMRETLYDALSDALPMMGGQTGDIILNVNGRELARATYDDFKQEQNRLGTSNVAVRRV